MKYIFAIGLLAFAAAPSVAQAQQMESGAHPSYKGYAAGASDSGKSGMASSRGAPTTPLAGAPGTTDNGHPFQGTNDIKASNH